jgi:CheY-like chemotaxis protein
MPDMNGVELFRATRKTHPHLITVLMTAYAADDIIQQGITERIQIVFSKPVNINFLLCLFSAIKRLITKTKWLLINL